MLQAIIYYVTLDTRFSRVFSHHFVLLNHFRHGIKVSIPFYLLSSLKDSIKGIREKTIANPPLHEGLMLLIYKHIKSPFNWEIS